MKDFKTISMKEAAQIMAKEDNYILLDVRTEEEYKEGHIPGAILIPNETIGTADIPELPNKEQKILVYCRTGRRSKEAAQKLCSKGYSDVYEIGGIVDWHGELK